MPNLPFWTVCVRLSVSAAAIRASSCVNQSNRLRASSISFWPMSFFRYFSDRRLAHIYYVSLRATQSLDSASSLLSQSPRHSALRSMSSRLCRPLPLSEALRYETRAAWRGSRCSRRDLQGHLGSLQHPWLPVTHTGVIMASGEGSRRLTERRTAMPEKTGFSGENT